MEKYKMSIALEVLIIIAREGFMKNGLFGICRVIFSTFPSPLPLIITGKSGLELGITK